jgi:signal transduction histidine kinase
MGVHERAGRAAAGRSVSIELARTGELPEGIHTDPERLAQVLDTLVEGALRRTEHGSVRIEVGSCEQHHGVCKHLTFSVVDTGRGFDEQELAYLFEPFGGRKRAAGEPEGSGLGLALAKRLAMLLGGDLNLESAAGQGTRFTLVLPLGVAAVRR